MLLVQSKTRVLGNRVLGRERLDDGGTCHHAPLMRFQCGKLPRSEFVAPRNSPKNPEEKNIDRGISAERPFPVTEPLLRQGESGARIRFVVRGAVNRRREKRHP